MWGGFGGFGQGWRGQNRGRGFGGPNRGGMYPNRGGMRPQMYNQRMPGMGMGMNPMGMGRGGMGMNMGMQRPPMQNQGGMNYAGAVKVKKTQFLDMKFLNNEFNEFFSALKLI